MEAMHPRKLIVLDPKEILDNETMGELQELERQNPLTDLQAIPSLQEEPNAVEDDRSLQDFLGKQSQKLNEQRDAQKRFSAWMLSEFGARETRESHKREKKVEDPAIAKLERNLRKTKLNKTSTAAYGKSSTATRRAPAGLNTGCPARVVMHRTRQYHRAIVQQMRESFASLDINKMQSAAGNTVQNAVEPREALPRFKNPQMQKAVEDYMYRAASAPLPPPMTQHMWNPEELPTVPPPSPETTPILPYRGSLKPQITSEVSSNLGVEYKRNLDQFEVVEPFSTTDSHVTEEDIKEWSEINGLDDEEWESLPKTSKMEVISANNWTLL
ncbi:hypothetical protein BP6252_06119 [Coleophoma cylindrospora]|uniref:Uncharacterized protein n=1 Tax=Coleophoma cylindrospora TaxID=1849047 RepID=A0A3D8RLP0_9HELO|nr:hypothetical protein BP6252_06119 [Coleophoma cylindrospora]